MSFRLPASSFPSRLASCSATYPAVTEIIYKYTGIATMGIKFFISVAQLLMPFFLGVVAGTSMSYLMLPVIAGVCIGILGILAIFAPFPATSSFGPIRRRNPSNSRWRR